MFNKSLKENYRPVNILPVFSKVFERSILSKYQVFLMTYFQNISKASEKGFSTQQCLLALLEK